MAADANNAAENHHPFNFPVDLNSKIQKTEHRVVKVKMCSGQTDETPYSNGKENVTDSADINATKGDVNL